MRNSAYFLTVTIAAITTSLLLAALFWGGGQRAFAHSDYDESTPAAGETVSESPARVDVFFTQEMARLGGLPTMIVVNQFGDLLADEPVLDDANRKHMYIDLPPALGPGRYTVIWHTLSDEDGQEARNAFHFFIGEVTGETTSATTTPAAATVSPPPTVVDSGDGDGGSDVPIWALIGGIAAGLAAGLTAGVTLAARRPS